jgi:metallo-beta-lactamase class B
MAPSLVTNYTKPFQVLKALPCDIFLDAHGSYYRMEAKYERLQKHPKANPFVDPAGYRAYVEDHAQPFQKAVRKHQRNE